MSLSKREIFLLCLLLVCGIAYAYYTYVYDPLQVQISQVQTDNRNLSREIEQLKKTEPAVEGVSSDALQKIKQDFWTAACQVPTYPLVPESIAFLEKSGKDAVIDLKSLQISDAGGAQPAGNTGNQASNSGLVTQSYEIAGTGGYFALNSFLMKLEEAPRIYVISSLDIGSQPAVTTTAAPPASTTAAPATVSSTASTQIYDGSNLTFTMSLSSYYDGIELESIGTSFQTVPPAAGRNNPFSS